MAKYRVGVIASGRIAREHGRGWTRCERTGIVAIADSHPAALASYAEDFGVESTYLDYREMMEKEELDIVIPDDDAREITRVSDVIAVVEPLLTKKS